MSVDDLAHLSGNACGPRSESPLTLLTSSRSPFPPVRPCTVPSDLDLSFLQPRFTVGHVCSAAEAAVLENVLQSLIQRKFSSEFRKAGPSADLSERITAFHASEPLPTPARSVPRDPILREARKLAKACISQQANARNAICPEGERLDALIDKVLASPKYASIWDAARSKVESLRRLSDDSIEAMSAVD